MTADTTPESLSEYTPTTEEILRGFTAPAYKIDPQREGESFGEWLGRCSIETMHSQIASEAAARRWLGAHDAEVARKALTAAAAEIPQQMRLDELALHQLDYTAQLPEPSQVMLNGATRFAERLVARAEQIGEN